MGTLGLIFQILAIAIGLVAIGLFAKSNLSIMKYRQFTPLGLLTLWTGSIDTNTLIIVNSKNNKVVEKELVKAIVWHKRTKYLIYVALVLNFVAFMMGAYS